MERTENGGGLGPRVLVVDDDRDLLDLLSFLIGQTGLIAVCATDPNTALEILKSEEPLLAMIDLNLKPWDGFELLGDIRRRNPRLPILVLTGRGSEDDKVRAFDLGADDYVVKPFGHRELVARIRAHARRASLDRAGEIPHATLEVGRLRLDLRERSLEIDGEAEVRLTGMEFRVLEQLMRNSNSVVPTGSLAKDVWGHDDAPARDVVRVTVHRLRRKLGETADGRKFIETVPGVGLRLRVVPTRRESERPL